MMGSSAGRDVRQTFDYPKVPGLALGDAAVTSRVECLHIVEGVEIGVHSTRFGVKRDSD